MIPGHTCPTAMHKTSAVRETRGTFSSTRAMDPDRIVLQEGSLCACCTLSTNLFADLHGRSGC